MVSEMFFRLTCMTNRDHSQFHKRATALIPRVSEIAQQYRQATSAEANALLEVVLCPVIEQIADGHFVQEKTISGFSDIVETQKMHFDNRLREAAHTLLNVFMLVGNEGIENLEQEIQEKSAMIEELRKPEMQDAMQKLKVTEWFEKLIKENQKLQQLANGDINQNSAVLKHIFRMHRARIKTDSCFKMLIRTHIDKMSPSEMKNDFILNQINEIFNQIVGSD